MDKQRFINRRKQQQADEWTDGQMDIQSRRIDREKGGRMETSQTNRATQNSLDNMF
jgi:hypothetical protein